MCSSRNSFASELLTDLWRSGRLESCPAFCVGDSKKPGGRPMKAQVPKITIGLCLGLCLTLCPALSFGQAVFGSITGTISDPSGAAVVSAKVMITETGKGVSYSTVTNDSGNYLQSHLTVGTYDVVVEAPGFETYARRNVRVNVDEVAQVNAQLTVGKVSDVV